MENKMLFYTPQPEEDIYELVMFTIAVPVCSVWDDFQIMYVLVVIVAGGGEQVLNWESFIQSLELAETTLLTTGAPEWSCPCLPGGRAAQAQRTLAPTGNAQARI